MSSEDLAALAVVIDAIGTDRLGAAVDAALRPKLSFDMSCAYLFRFNRNAIMVHGGYDQSVSEKTISAYVRGGYLHDPFYVACINNHPAGLWRMSNLAPDCFYSSGFSVSKDIHPCVCTEHGTSIEEVGYIIPIGHQVAIVYTLMRSTQNGGFGEAEMELLDSVAPIVTAAFEMHFKIRYSQSHTIATSSDNKLEDAFIEMLKGQLTETQSLIAKLILQGHSNTSIARELKISEGTVKVHKHNIYQRLAISTHPELFRLFIDYIS